MDYTKSEAETRHHIEQSFPCGCEIRHYTHLYSLDESYGITYCPLHKSAPELYEACKLALLLSEQPVLQNNADVQMLTNTLKAALRQS